MKLLLIGTTELLLISGAAILLFGGKKIPELMKSLGQGVKSFKEGMNTPLQEENAKEGEEEKFPPVEPNEKEDGGEK